MGNLSVKFDIVSALPPELVLLIISHLCLKDVTSCLLVCRMWYKVISNLGPYWQNMASNTLGLHSDLVLTSAPHYATRRDFYLAATKHRRILKASKLKCRRIPVDVGTMGHELFTHCLYARGSMIVRTKLNAVGQGSILLLERLGSSNPHTNVAAPYSLEPVHSFPLHPISKVAWAYTNGSHLFWVTRTGIWNCYDVAEKRRLFCWWRCLLNEGYGVAFSCCDQCFLVVGIHWTPVAVGANSTTTVYSIQVVDLGGMDKKPREFHSMKTFTVCHSSHCVYVNHDSRYWIREAAVLPQSEKKHEGLCQEHMLIVQCDCCMVIQKISMPDCKLSSPQCINCYSLQELESKRSHLRSHSSRFTLTSDKTKLGVILNGKLHVWKLAEPADNNQDSQSNISGNITTLKLLTSGRLDDQPSSPNAIELVSLGHVYAIVAYIYDNCLTDYKICIVSTSTGDTLTACRRVARFCDWTTCNHMDPLHKFYFTFGEEGGEWLDDIRWGVPDIPLVTVHNHHGRIYLEAVTVDRSGVASGCISH